jgi:hypothetical protein
LRVQSHFARSNAIILTRTVLARIGACQQQEATLFLRATEHDCLLFVVY